MKQPLILVVCLMLFGFNVSATVRYVDLNCTNATSPYADWSNAATDIQSAVDASSNGDLIWVNDGVYQTGGRVVIGSLTNRVAINKRVTVQSVHGPVETIIRGYQVPGTTNGDSAVRCVYMTNGAVLSGFTLTGGATIADGSQFPGLTFRDESGGGLWGETSAASIVTNCIIQGNTAFAEGGGVYCVNEFDPLNTNLCNFNNCAIIGNSAIHGGGVAGGVLRNCTVTGNIASFTGGGVYGGFLHNCTLTENRAVYGGGAMNGAILYNCTLIGNQAQIAGGGASQCTLYNCTLTANFADHGGGADSSTLYSCMLSGNLALTNAAHGYGGGVSGGTSYYCTFLNNGAQIGGGANGSYLEGCVLAHNWASFRSGGADGCGLTNCTVVNNKSAGTVGGVGGSYFFVNCIVYYNSGVSPNYTFFEVMTNCCTWPLPELGIGNIQEEPRFVNLDAGDYHLQSNSPCINAGNNSYAANLTDLDVNPRIQGSSVDIGAYEYQTPSSILSYAWAQQYGLVTDGLADTADTDGDGLNNWQEWKSGTIPTNAASVLQLSSPSNTVSGVMVTWQSVSGVTYYLQSSTNLAASPAFVSIKSNLVGQAATTSYTDSTATNSGLYFYRVGVQ